ncbi:HEPN domain-containing protein [Desulfobacula sp.]|uniref:HEPN domain-containing protein n=1 Tax=Desulfobacula sp. TaxID=2593537 RepID=UPI002715150F|nr:HEPN domain-containing protein [Desulfobacula sp.]
MTYSFRIRINSSLTNTIQTEESEIAIPSENENYAISLRSENGLPIKESDQFSLIGSGYPSEEEANSEGVKIQRALMVALAKVRIGADYGHRAAKSVMTKYGLKWAEKKTGVRVRLLDNTHGLMVYKTYPKPKFVSVSGQFAHGANCDSFVEIFTKLIQKEPVLRERDLVAFTLFNASFFHPTSDSRFVLLVMAIEALIEPIERSPDAVLFVDNLIKQTKYSEIEKNEKDSIVGSLNWLRKESINQAGKRLVSSRIPTEQKYNGMSPEKFFSKCYQLRSDLVHGNIPYPTFKEIGSVVGTLEVLVSDLLTKHFLEEIE